ncbi:MAG TPA: homoserine kinase [Rhodobiaceae bacterium]|jgi:homoserine kinase type II|nr:homoserine kinase [Rhodobiaceae bacterium]
MAVYTEIDDATLAQFGAQYPLSSIDSLKGITQGVQNSNFLLTTAQAKYILTIYESSANGVAAADLPFFLGLMLHLSANGLSCPVPLARKDGGLISTVKDKPAALVSFLEGRSVKTPRPEHCRALGAAMAQMHVAGAGFELRRANNHGLANWQALFERCHDRADEVSPDLTRAMERELARLEENWPDNLPAGIIHADLFPDNVFFVQGEVSGLIDFYFACNDFYAYDLAIALNAWCFEADATFNVTKARALLSGYQNVRALSPEEIDAVPILGAGAAMRFLTTRLFDWLNQVDGAQVEPKNPNDFLRRLRFHRSATRPADYGLTL